MPGIEFETAIETIEIISENTEDKQMYDQREKAQRDYEWALSGAREEGELLGLEKGERLERIKWVRPLKRQRGLTPLVALTTAIQILAIEIKFHAAEAGFDVLDVWANSDDSNREMLVGAMASAKDQEPFSYTDTKRLYEWGVSSWHILRSGAILDN